MYMYCGPKALPPRHLQEGAPPGAGPSRTTFFLYIAHILCYGAGPSFIYFLYFSRFFHIFPPGARRHHAETSSCTIFVLYIYIHIYMYTYIYTYIYIYIYIYIDKTCSTNCLGHGHGQCMSQLTFGAFYVRPHTDGQASQSSEC